MAAKKESVAKCAGPFQYGVGRPDGGKYDDQDHLVPGGSR